MKHLYRALAAFQQEVPVLHKGSQGYSYSYTDLPSIFRAINPLMQKHGLGFYQSINGKSLTTTVFHVESGEKISGKADIPQNVQLKGMNDFQVLGSAITYLRRYQLSAMLGLVTDKDTDAAGEPYSYSTAVPDTNRARDGSGFQSAAASSTSRSAASTPPSSPSPSRRRTTSSSVGSDAKLELKPESVGWQRALNYLKNKGSVQDVKRKYNLSPENEIALLKEAGVTDN